MAFGRSNPEGRGRPETDILKGLHEAARRQQSGELRLPDDADPTAPDAYGLPGLPTYPQIPPGGQALVPRPDAYPTAPRAPELPTQYPHPVSGPGYGGSQAGMPAQLGNIPPGSTINIHMTNGQQGSPAYDQPRPMAPGLGGYGGGMDRTMSMPSMTGGMGPRLAIQGRPMSERAFRAEVHGEKSLLQRAWNYRAAIGSTAVVAVGLSAAVLVAGWKPGWIPTRNKEAAVTVACQTGYSIPVKSELHAVGVTKGKLDKTTTLDVNFGSGGTNGMRRVAVAVCAPEGLQLNKTKGMNEQGKLVDQLTIDSENIQMVVGYEEATEATSPIVKTAKATDISQFPALAALALPQDRSLESTAGRVNQTMAFQAAIGRCGRIATRDFLLQLRADQDKIIESYNTLRLFGRAANKVPVVPEQVLSGRSVAVFPGLIASSERMFTQPATAAWTMAAGSKGQLTLTNPDEASKDCKPIDMKNSIPQSSRIIITGK
jgi:hypothetical protein